jgi:hypothetical protein
MFVYVQPAKMVKPLVRNIDLDNIQHDEWENKLFPNICTPTPQLLHPGMESNTQLTKLFQDCRIQSGGLDDAELYKEFIL